VDQDEGEPQTVRVPAAESASQFGTPTVSTSASWTWLVKGFRHARARLAEAAGQRDVEETFIPLFETLNWAVAIEYYARKRGPKIDGGPKINRETLRGLRFARNRVHHQWADALEPRDVPNPSGLVTRGGRGPRIVGPPVVVEWFWKPVVGLGKAPKKHDDPDGEAAYEKHLAGQPARLALDHLDSLLPPRST
jgi:hypothetical protein